jgi:LacI family transcriptional regulator
MVSWLSRLPKPCGIFTCCDSWTRVVARYAKVASLRIPEDLPLVGVDNDVLECELVAPHLSSVAVPWQTLGRSAASLVHQSLSGAPIWGKRIVISPVGVVVRGSSDIAAVDDPLVLCALHWIREHANGRLTVPMVARGVSASRQRLERRFRAVLGRSVLGEIRRARVELAKNFLSNTSMVLPEIAKRSGFTNAALLTVAFRRELGLPPASYRRLVRMGSGED